MQFTKLEVFAARTVAVLLASLAILLRTSDAGQTAGSASIKRDQSQTPRSLTVSEPGTGVLTQHNDNLRSGAYLKEAQLNVANVQPGTFGKLFSRPVRGQIYAQPLYVPNVRMKDGSVHNVVYVATMRNLVFAFDADDPSVAGSQPLWIDSLGAPLPYNFMRMVPDPAPI